MCSYIIGGGILLAFNIIKDNHATYNLLDNFHLTLLKFNSIMCHLVYSFCLLHNIPLCEHLALFIYSPVMGTEVLSRFSLLGTRLL